MPGSDFSKFKRELFWQAVSNVCAEITIANGYNTQPFVTNDPREAQSAEEAFVVLVTQGIESIIEVAVGGCMSVDLQIEVYGYAMSKDTNPTIQLNKLIQDVRNSLATNLGRICDFTEAGTALSFGDLETDSGVLAMDGMAAFALPVHFTYKAGPVW